MDIEQEFEKFVEEVELNEKWEVGVVYHQDFGGGEISYFRADSLLKNKRWKGMSVDEYGGKQKKPRNITADEKVQGWKITPKDKIPKGLKEEVETEAKLKKKKKKDKDDFAFGISAKGGWKMGLGKDRHEEVEVDEAKSKLPPHLAKFFDKAGNLKKDAAARVAKGKEKINWIDVTPKGYGPKDEEPEFCSTPGLSSSLKDKCTVAKKADREREVKKKKTIAQIGHDVGAKNMSQRNEYNPKLGEENMKDLITAAREILMGEDTDKDEPGTQGDAAEYQKKRDEILKGYGVKACGLIKDEKEKKQCFQDLDDAHVGDHEEGYSYNPHPPKGKPTAKMPKETKGLVHTPAEIGLPVKKKVNESFWKVNIPEMPVIFIETNSKSEIITDMRKKLKPDVFKELSIERVTKAEMIKTYRQLVKGEGGDADEVKESAGLQLKMAFDDAGIKIKGVIGGKLVIDKKYQKKAEKVISKQMKKPADAKRVLGSQIKFEDVTIGDLLDQIVNESELDDTPTSKLFSHVKRIMKGK